MVGLLLAAVLIVMALLGYGLMNSQTGSNSTEVTPANTPTQPPLLEDPVKANQTIDEFEEAINSTLEQQQHRVEDIEKQLLGE